MNKLVHRKNAPLLITVLVIALAIGLAAVASQYGLLLRTSVVVPPPYNQMPGDPGKVNKDAIINDAISLKDAYEDDPDDETWAAVCVTFLGQIKAALVFWQNTLSSLETAKISAEQAYNTAVSQRPTLATGSVVSALLPSAEETRLKERLDRIKADIVKAQANIAFLNGAIHDTEEWCTAHLPDDEP